MISGKKELYGGTAMLAGFLVILVLIFLPLFNGQNGLNYLDNLFNSISKGSAYYIPAVRTEVNDTAAGKQVDLCLAFDSAARAQETARLLTAGGATARVTERSIAVTGDLGRILNTCLDDADLLFYNQGEKLTERYDRGGREVLYTWWMTLQALQETLNKQEKFTQARLIYTVTTKAVECAYNYHGIMPEQINDKMGMVVFALVFYVLYTLWYGYAILFIFEGAGLQISSH